jgi:hypothetical protein
MAKSKYSIVKGKSGKSKKVIVMGKKKVLYKKVGSTSMYVISKGRHIKLSAYKKSKMKGGGQDGGVRRRREGNNNLMGQNQDGGAKKKRRKRRRTKK